MPKTKLVVFNVVTCVQDAVATVTLRVPFDANEDLYENEYGHRAMKKAGVRQHRCESCYDWRYRAVPVTD